MNTATPLSSLATTDRPVQTLYTNLDVAGQTIPNRVKALAFTIFGTLATATTYGALYVGCTTFAGICLVGVALLFSCNAVALFFIDTLPPAEKPTSSISGTLTPKSLPAEPQLQLQLLPSPELMSPQPTLSPSPQEVTSRPVSPIREVQPEPIRLPHHHPLDQRVVRNPTLIELRMKKALVDAAKDLKDGYNAYFDEAIAASVDEPIYSIDSKQINVGDTEAAVAETQGRRLEMEDSHIATSLSFTSAGEEVEAKIFGVFDGHGGSQASKFVSKNIHTTLSKNLALYCKQSITDANVYQALRNTFLDLDRSYLTARPENAFQAGTTACVALMINGDLFVANAGDSRAVLKNGSWNLPQIRCYVQQLTRDHKPSLPQMMKAVHKRGGVILGEQNRVNGILAVARGIGDWGIRDLDDEIFKLISPLPKVCKIAKKNIAPGSKLILACDGLWDRASSYQAGQAVQWLENQGVGLVETAERLANAALEAESWDNISVMVVAL